MKVASWHRVRLAENLMQLGHLYSLRYSETIYNSPWGHVTKFNSPGFVWSAIRPRTSAYYATTTASFKILVFACFRVLSLDVCNTNNIHQRFYRGIYSVFPLFLFIESSFHITWYPTISAHICYAWTLSAYDSLYSISVLSLNYRHFFLIWYAIFSPHSPQRYKGICGSN